MNVILSSGGSTILYVELLNEKGENQPYSHRFLPFSISPPRYRTETCFKDKLHGDPYHRGVIPYHDD